MPPFSWMQAAPSGQSACRAHAFTQPPPGKSASTTHIEPSAHVSDGPPDVVQLPPTTLPSVPTSSLPHAATTSIEAMRMVLIMPTIIREARAAPRTARVWGGVPSAFQLLEKCSRAPSIRAWLVRRVDDRSAAAGPASLTSYHPRGDPPCAS